MCNIIPSITNGKFFERKFATENFEDNAKDDSSIPAVALVQSMHSC